RELGDELGARDEVGQVSLLVRLEQLLEARLPDDDALVDLALVSEEGRVAGRALGVSEGGLVCADDEVAGLLELDREEEGGTGVDPLDLDTVRVRAAGSDALRPEGEAGRVALPVEEVVVVLADEWAGFVNGVRGRLRGAVRDLGGGGRGQRRCG